jgi:glycosyltransferase involved in cell wall biosynthesis
MLEESHGLTLSTTDLAAQYYTCNKNIHVLENQIDYALRNWDHPITRIDDALYVGWTGGAQHQEDLAFMATWLSEVIMAHDHVKFVMCTNLDIARDFCENHLKLPPEKYEIIEPRKFEDYPPVISHIDIGLAPVEASKFNCSKSGLKIQEYGSWGVATVASKFVPYQRLAGNRDDVILVENTATAWKDAVNQVVLDETLRKQMGTSLRKYIRARHDMKDHIYKWTAAYKDIRETTKQKDAGRGTKISYLNPGRNDPCPCGSGKKYKKCECYPAYST